MKKLLAILCAVLLSSISYGGMNRQLESAVLRHEAVSHQATRKQQAHSLYEVVSTQLQQYYGRTHFEDPEHQTGWYRVQNFLTWVKNHNDELENSPYNYFYLNNKAKLSVPKYYYYKVSDFLALDWNKLPDYVIQGFWSYLGMRYLSEIYHKDFDFSTFVIGGVTGQIPTGVQYGVIFLNNQTQSVMPQAINIGMHEGTHYLPLLQGHETAHLLSELATFYSGYNFSLPVKKEDTQTFAAGARDVRRVYDLRPDLSFVNEYNLFITGLILNNHLTPGQVLTLKEGSFHSDVSIWEMVLGLLAARQNRFMRTIQPADNEPIHLLPVNPQDLTQAAARFGFSEQEVQSWLANPSKVIELGEGIWPESQANAQESVVLAGDENKYYFVGNLRRVNEQEYMKLHFGELANIPQLTEFYNNLLAALPPEILQNIDKEFPLIDNTSAPRLYDVFVAPYEKQWNHAVIRALQAVTTQSNALPPGYL